MKSVYFTHNNQNYYHPILVLGREKIMTLHFDMIEGSPRNLAYSLYHYDRNWNPSGIEYQEAIDGFEEEEIFNYKTSIQTLIPYVHYQLKLPNARTKFKISGNYLLVVYDKDGGNLFTRRIFVTLNNFGIALQFVSPANPEHYRSSHALELNIKSNGNPINNPSQEFSLQILQNDNYLTLQHPTEPSYFTRDLIQFRKLDGIIFPAAKEFRRKDIRTTIHLTQDIDYWDEKFDNYHCWLEYDKVRKFRPFYSDTDINGGYACMSNDIPDELNQDEIRSDYVMAHFTLESPIQYDEDVYIYGALSDYQCKPEYKMTYNDEKKAYQGQILLKNGFYNFIYATLNQKNQIDISQLEGDWYETENNYIVLCYYRPFGSRYDQLVYAGNHNSNN